MKKLLEEAALFRALAAAFRYPDAETRKTVTAMFAALHTGDGTRRRSVARADLLQRVEDAWSATDGAALESEYLRLFHGAGSCALRETAYGDGRRIAGRSAELADIAGFYRAFGLRVAERRPDLPDHLSAELELMSLLLLKEAYAISQGWTERRAIARDAQKEFLASHLGRWVGALADALAANDAPLIYLALVDVVGLAVRRQCRRFRIAPKLAEGRLPRDFMQDDGFDCPRAGGENANARETSDSPKAAEPLVH